MQTETIDKLYLELSQITSARTYREIDLRRALRELVKCKDMSIKIKQGKIDAAEKAEFESEYERRKDVAWQLARKLIAEFDDL